MENNNIISIVTDSEYHNIKHNCDKITCEPGVFYVDREEDNIYVLSKDVWAVTVDEEDRIRVVLAENYGDAQGPYAWKGAYPWKKSN